MIESTLKSLGKRNAFLKSKLLHERMRHGEIPLTYSKKYSLDVLNGYKESRSIFKSADIVGINPNVAINWYVQGQLGNPHFRGFYLLIQHINDSSEFKVNADSSKEVAQEEISEGVFDVEGDYAISEYGDGWSYKAFIDGEKVFLISDDLSKLKKKVRDRNLPLD